MQTCSVGARVWGVVSDVTHHGITVSLPDGLKGHISVEEVQHYYANFWNAMHVHWLYEAAVASTTGSFSLPALLSLQI